MISKIRGAICSTTGPSYMFMTVRFKHKQKKNTRKILPKKVALGELYAMYSLFDAQPGNSFCLTAPPSAPSSSPRFHGSCDSVAVGVVTRVVSPNGVGGGLMPGYLTVCWKKDLPSESLDSRFTLPSSSGIGTFSDFSPTEISCQN